MPDTQEAGAAHPSDATGANWTPPPGEPEGRANIAHALGLHSEHTQDTEDESDSQEGRKPEPEEQDESDREPKPKASQKPDALEGYSAKVQTLAEETYAYALNRARTDETYLDKLALSEDPIDKRLFEKLLARNDFGAKNPQDFKRKQIVKNAGKDPRDQAIAEMRLEIENLKGSRSEDSWSSWKKENALQGEAAALADSVHYEYPDMPFKRVLATVRGELGLTNTPSQKEQMGYLRGGLGAVPESDGPNLESSLARALLPKDIKKTQKFAKSLLGRR